MSNSKANRTTLQWPPVIDLKSNSGSVDTTFKYYKKINTPYLNNMLSPLYKRNGSNKAVFDKQGNKYSISQDILYKNNEELWTIENKKFVRTNVTNHFKDYLSFDISGSNEATLSFNDSDNTVTLNYRDGNLVSPQLFDEGAIVTSRVRIVNNYAIAVVYFTDNSNEYIQYMKYKPGDYYQIRLTATWYTQYARTNPTGTYTPTAITIKNADPIIFITGLINDTIGVSLISDYGNVVNPVQTGFITFADKGNNLYVFNGTDLKPASTASSESVTSTYNNYFYITASNTQTNQSGACLRDPDDSTVYYDYSTEGVVGDPMNFPIDYTPTNTGETVEINGVTYGKFRYNRVQLVENTRVACPSNPYPADTWSIIITYKNGDTITQTSEAPNTAIDYTRTRYNYGSGTAQVGMDSVQINWKGETGIVPKSYWGRSAYLMSYTETSIQTVNWLVAPNVFFDDGKMYSFWRFTVSTASSWPMQLPAGNRIIESCQITQLDDSTPGSIVYSFTTNESINITSDYNVPRSIGYNINQGLFEATVKLNNTATQYPNAHATSATVSASYHWLEYMNSNSTELRYFPGTSRYTAFNYYANAANIKDNTDGTAAGGREDYAVYVVSGFRAQLGNTHWNILVNTSLGGTSLPNGISYSGYLTEMGTLVTPWASIDDDTYVVADETRVIYRDNSNRWWQISIDDDVELYTLLDDRYIIINTTSYWNCYDSVLNRKFHYATDYNGRALHGSSTASYMSGDQYYSRLCANAINAAYVIQPRLAVTSLILPYVGRVRVKVDDIKAFNSTCPEDNDTQGIDIYYGGQAGETESTWPSCKYQFTLYPYQVPVSKKNFSLERTTYAISTASSSLVSPNIFTQYVNNPGNRDAVKEIDSFYTLIYIINNSTPIFAYSNTSEALNVTDFFCLQGQFYAVINDKIYSIVYDDGVISEQDAIIDIRGMQFIGANPRIAFFWSSQQRAIYSFTGDALLQHFAAASEITGLYSANSDLDSRYFYDESSQSIFVPTTYGLFVIGPNNHYLLPEYTKVTNVQFSDDDLTHITNDGITDDISYYPRDEFDAIPADLESDWWGQGDENIGIIDRWQIVLYDITGTSPKTYVKVGTRSLNDISATSEIKELTINPADWDKWSHSVLINYNPKLIKGKATRLLVETPMIIAEITAHAATNNAVNLSKHSI